MNLHIWLDSYIFVKRIKSDIMINVKNVPLVATVTKPAFGSVCFTDVNI